MHVVDTRFDVAGSNSSTLKEELGAGGTPSFEPISARSLTLTFPRVFSRKDLHNSSAFTNLFCPIGSMTDTSGRSCFKNRFQTDPDQPKAPSIFSQKLRSLQTQQSGLIRVLFDKRKRRRQHYPPRNEYVRI